MQEFIQMAVQKLSADEATIRSATGGLLGFIQDRMRSEDAGKLIQGLPGAAQLLDQGRGSAGGMGGLLGKASSMLGGSGLGAAAGLASALGNSGLDKNQWGKFVNLFLGFAKQKLGDDMVTNILGKVPELKKLGG